MRATIALFLIGALAMVSANQAVHQALAEIHQHPFGATILTAIKANLAASSSGATIEQVETDLVGILSDLQKDSDILDSNHKIRRDHLTGAIDNKEKLIASTEQAIQALEDNIASLTANITRDTATLEKVVSDLAQANTDYQANEAHYAKWKPVYVANVADLRQAKDAVKRATAKMETYKAAVTTSLIQVASSAKAEIMAFSTQLHALKPVLSKLGPEFSPLVFELIALTANPDYSVADKILDLLAQLRDQVDTGLTNELAALSHLESNYASEKSRLQDLIDRLSARQAALTAQIELDTETRKNNIADRDALKETLAREQANLATLKKQLEIEDKTYEAESTKAANLISLMDRLIKYWRSKTEDVSSYVKTAVNTGVGA